MEFASQEHEQFGRIAATATELLTASPLEAIEWLTATMSDETRLVLTAIIMLQEAANGSTKGTANTIRGFYFAAKLRAMADERALAELMERT